MQNKTLDIFRDGFLGSRGLLFEVRCLRSQAVASVLDLPWSTTSEEGLQISTGGTCGVEETRKENLRKRSEIKTRRSPLHSLV